MGNQSSIHPELSPQERSHHIEMVHKLQEQTACKQRGKAGERGGNKKKIKKTKS